MSMFRRARTTHLLALLALAILAAEARMSSQALPAPAIMLVAAGLVGLSLVFPLTMPPIDISLAHAVGLTLLFISGPVAAAGVVAAGALLALAVRQAWPARRSDWRPALLRLSTDIAQQALPLGAAAIMYRLLGGGFPIDFSQSSHWPRTAALALAFFLFFEGMLWQVSADAQSARLTLTDRLILTALEILPIPVTLFTAATYTLLGPVWLANLAITLLMLIASLHAMSQAQARLRNQARYNAGQFEAAQALLREAQFLREGGAALTSTLQRRAIYSAVTHRLAEVVRADGAAVLEYQNPPGWLDLAYQWSAAGIQMRPLPEAVRLENYPSPETWLRQHAALALRSDQPDLEPAARRRLDLSDCGALLILPLVADESVVGLVELYSRQPRDFDAEMLRLARPLARQAAAAVANAALLEAAEESRDRLMAVLNSTHEGVLVVDSSGVVTLANPSLEEMLSLPANRLVDRTLPDLMREQDLEIAQRLGFAPDEIEEMLLTLKAGLALSIPRREYAVAYPRPRQLERTGAPVLDQLARAIGWVVVVRDITEAKEIETMRAGLSSMIVHDLRSPLNSILVSLTLLNDQLPPDSRNRVVEQSLDVARRSVQRLMGMVNDLLEMSRLEAGQVPLNRIPLDMRQLADDVLVGLTPQASEQDLFLLNEVPAGLPAVNVDRDKIGRVLMNLLDNALKFAPAGSQVVIAARQADGALECSVLDSGPGVPPENRFSVFDRFVQAGGPPGRRGGVGLGLAFCKLAVEAHGGRIWVDARPEGGSAFRFTLPL